MPHKIPKKAVYAFDLKGNNSKMYLYLFFKNAVYAFDLKGNNSAIMLYNPPNLLCMPLI